MADLVLQHAIERAARNGHGALLAKLLEQRHRHGLSKTEDLDGHARDIVLEGIGRATRELEGLSDEARAPFAARGKEHLVTELRVRDLVADDAETRAYEIRRSADLKEPKREVLRAGRRSILGLDPTKPLRAHRRTCGRRSTTQYRSPFSIETKRYTMKASMVMMATAAPHS
jgi:hypothetical protein